MKRSFTVLGLAIVLLVSSTAQLWASEQLRSESSVRNGELFFSAMRWANAEWTVTHVIDGNVYSVGEGGDAARQVTSYGIGEVAYEPTVSPDGRSIVYASWRGDDSDIMVARADGSGEQTLVDAAGNQGDPAWSPDASFVAYVDYAFDPARLSVIDVRTHKIRRYPLPAAPGSLSWSPEGRAIAFDMAVDDQDAVYVIDLGSGRYRRITGKPHLAAYSPDWSPDGRRLAFVRERFGEPSACTEPWPLDRWVCYGAWASDISVIRLDGTGERRVTDTGGATYEEAPAWSPDGKRIAFVGATPNWSSVWDLWSIRVDGTDRKLVYTFDDRGALKHQSVLMHHIYSVDWAPKS